MLARLFLLPLLSALPLAAAEPEREAIPIPMLVRNWSTREGLPQGHVRALIHSSDGFLWLATDGGLARFDGFEFKSYGMPEGLRSAAVLSLLEARDGSLWMGTMGGGLSVIREGRIVKTYTRADGLPSETVTLLAQDGEGKIWVADRAGFARLTGERFEPVEGSPRDGPSSWLPALFGARDGSISACFSDGSVWSWKDRKWQRPEPGGPSQVSAFCEDAEGRIWAGDRNRRLWCREADGTWKSHQAPGERNFISSLSVAPDGTIWLAFFRSGVLAFRDGKFIAPETRGEPFLDVAESVLAGPGGQVWIGSSNRGVYALAPSKIQMAVAEGGEAARTTNFIGALAESSSGTFVAGSQGAGFFQWREGKAERFIDSAIPGPFLFVNVMRKSPDGTLWAGTGKGLLQIRDGLNVPWPRPAALNSDIWDLTDDPAGGLWIGTGMGTLYQLQDGRATEVPFASKRVPVKGLAFDHEGSLWVGTRGEGLYQRRDGAWRRYGRDDGLPSELIRTIHPGKDDALWIGTLGGGLVLRQGERFLAISSREGLPDDTISQILEDREGRLWLGTNKGLAILSSADVAKLRKGEAGPVYPRVIDRYDGLLSEEFTVVPPVKTSDGRLAFATTEGFAILKAADFPQGESMPPVFLEKVIADGREVSSKGGKVELPPGVKRLEFRFTGLHFAAPGRLRFRNRLIGLEDAWGEPDFQRMAEYRNLSAGNYRFEVSASTGNGLWSKQAAAVEIIIRPHLWERWWFRASAAATLVLLVAYFVRQRERARAQVRIRKLEREQAVDAERARIARDLHDDVGASLTQVALLSQLAEGSIERQPEKAGEQVREIFNTVREVTDSLEEIVWAVNPDNDTLENFMLYLGNLVQSFSHTAGLRSRFDMPENLPAITMPATARHHLYLATKEILHNVVKHAQATEVRMRLSLDARGFALTVEDDGIGFEGEEGDFGPDADGLRNLRRRLEQIGGKCLRHAAPGKGTAVEMQVPFAALK